MDFEEYSCDFSVESSIEKLLGVISLKEALDQLPDDQCVVMLLNSCGFKQWEIAKILGVSRITVWNKKKLALENLRNFMKSGVNNIDEGT